MAGNFVWFDVTTRAAEPVRSFYAELFGWPTAPADDAGGYRAWILDGEAPWAGVSEVDDATTGRWLPYVQVDDLEAAKKKATSLGATVVQDATEGPAGTAVTLADPAGALVALFVPRAA